MDDLISRKAAIDLWEAYHTTIAVDAMAYDKALRELPSAEPERKTGKWIIWAEDRTEWYHVTCSECVEDVTATIPLIGMFPNYKALWNFCPYCGTKMEVEDGRLN